MGGTTTSWSTDGAAKVGESQVETRVRIVVTTKGHGLAGTHKSSFIPKLLESVVWKEPGRGVREPPENSSCASLSSSRLSAAATGPSQLCRWRVPAPGRASPAQPPGPEQCRHEGPRRVGLAAKPHSAGGLLR